MDHNTLMAVLGAALTISEALSLIPKLKSNGIIQLMVNVLKTVTGKE